MAKKKPKFEEEKKHHVIKTYTLGDIEVRVAIDFDNERISLLEKGILEPGSLQPKKWIFAHRGLEYMQGWRNILDAMQNAIDRASSELNVEIKRRALQEELDTF